MKNQYVLRLMLEVVVTELEYTKQVYWRLKMKKRMRTKNDNDEIHQQQKIPNYIHFMIHDEWNKGECINASMDAIRFVET